MNHFPSCLQGCLLDRSSNPLPGAPAGRLPEPPSSWLPDRRDNRGQATAEYALVILGAAALAMLVLAWASTTSSVASLLDAVLDAVASRVS